MEKGDAPLEEALKLFEEGMSLVKFCNDKLNEAESKLQRLVKNEDGTFQLDLNE
jgi:exodeoxyribonuclease VII small subunit